MDITIHFKKNHLPLRIIMVFAFIFLAPCFASAYSVSYEYEVYAYATRDFPINLPISDEQILEGVSSTSGSITQPGGIEENYATIDYYANLATGAIGLYAYAESDRLYARGSVGKIGFSDTLTFFVPEGYYADDLTVTLSGAITGTLSATATAHAQAGYYISFPGNVFMTSDGPYNAETTSAVYDPFELTRTLVSAGTNLESDSYFSCDLTASLNRASAWTPNQWSAPYYYAEAEVDFSNTLQFTDIIVPDGITWTSESGVFLSEYPGPTPVPVPATMLLLGSGLAGLAGFRRKFKKA